MSRAFVREAEGEWLGDVKPTLPALLRYLTKENNGRPVTVVKSYISAKHNNREVHQMNTGSCYTLSVDGRWEII